MESLELLESCVDELVTTTKAFARSRRESQQSRQEPFLGLDLQQAERSSVLSSLARIYKVVAGPSDLFRHLENQIELLACLRWLAEFQVLACIPIAESVPIQDLADLTRVPQGQLTRVVRLTAASGFLAEPQAGMVAHTAMSAPSVANSAWLDGITFLADSAAPSALYMPRSTQARLHDDGRLTGFNGPAAEADMRGHADGYATSAWSLLAGNSTSFSLAVAEQPKLSRQWDAYRCYSASLFSADDVVNIFMQLDWLKALGNACIVIIEVGALSVSVARLLVDRFPAMQVILQSSNSAALTSEKTSYSDWERDRRQSFSGAIAAGGGYSSIAVNPDTNARSHARITTMHRSPNSRQTMTDAAVYVLTASCSILAELEEHVNILCANNAVMMILAKGLLPEPGSIHDLGTEISIRANDFTLLNLTGQGGMEMSELMDGIEMVHDRQHLGRLVVVSKLRSKNHAIVALEVKYRIFAA